MGDFEQLKISAFKKLSLINKDIKEVTIGPLALKQEEIEQKPVITERTKSPEPKNSFVKKTLYRFDNIYNKIDAKRREELQQAIQAHVNRIEDYSQKQEIQSKQQLQKNLEIVKNGMQQKESNIFQALHEFDRNNSDEHARRNQHYQMLAEQRQIRREELEAQERHKQLLRSYLNTIKEKQQAFRQDYQAITVLLKTCKNNEELKNILGSDFKLLKTLPEGLEEVIINCKSTNITEEHIKKCVNLSEKILTLKSKIQEAVKSINENAEKIKKEPPRNVQVTQVLPSNMPITEIKQDVKISEVKVSEINKFLSIENLKLYTNIMTILEQNAANIKAIEEDSSHKQFKFDCQKAINIPVNALSGTNSEHILDKYIRLYKLLKGENVLVGDKHFNASIHPQGIGFCMDLLAKKFVLQGDLIVSSNPESAFCYATVIVSLWNDFPLFGQLLLAYFYKSCPYLVPYNIPKQVGETDEDYYKKQGYQYVKGQIEKQDKFLKRMTGIMRLYAAILVVKPKKGQSKMPHSIAQGWRWLASLLKLEPQVDITATMLHTFLETVGFEMETKYGRIFQKLMKIVINKFLQSCRLKCTGGAVARLELLLEDYVKNGRLEKPTGYVEYSYW